MELSAKRSEDHEVFWTDRHEGLASMELSAKRSEDHDVGLRPKHGLHASMELSAKRSEDDWLQPREETTRISFNGAEREALRRRGNP